MPGWSALFAVLSMVLSSSCNIVALWESCWYLSWPHSGFLYCRVFPDLPDNPAVAKAIVMRKRLVLPSPCESNLLLFDFVSMQLNIMVTATGLELPQPPKIAYIPG